MPADDSLEDHQHINSEDCWCHPVVFFENEITGLKVTVHQETNVSPPAKVLAEAIANTFKDDEPDHLYDFNGDKIE